MDFIDAMLGEQESSSIKSLLTPLKAKIDVPPLMDLRMSEDPDMDDPLDATNSFIDVDALVAHNAFLTDDSLFEIIQSDHDDDDDDDDYDDDDNHGHDHDNDCKEGEANYQLSMMEEMGEKWAVAGTTTATAIGAGAGIIAAAELKKMGLGQTTIIDDEDNTIWKIPTGFDRNHVNDWPSAFTANYSVQRLPREFSSSSATTVIHSECDDDDHDDDMDIANAVVANISKSTSMVDEWIPTDLRLALDCHSLSNVMIDSLIQEIQDYVLYLAKDQIEHEQLFQAALPNISFGEIQRYQYFKHQQAQLKTMFELRLKTELKEMVSNTMNERFKAQMTGLVVSGGDKTDFTAFPASNTQAGQMQQFLFLGRERLLEQHLDEQAQQCTPALIQKYMDHVEQQLVSEQDMNLDQILVFRMAFHENPWKDDAFFKIIAANTRVDFRIAKIWIIMERLRLFPW